MVIIRIFVSLNIYNQIQFVFFGKNDFYVPILPILPIFPSTTDRDAFENQLRMIFTDFLSCRKAIDIIFW